MDGLAGSGDTEGSHTAARTYNCEATVQNALATPQKMKHTITIRPSRSTSRFIHRRIEMGT